MALPQVEELGNGSSKNRFLLTLANSLRRNKKVMGYMQIICPKCNSQFNAEAIHSGFNDSEFVYCQTCHRVAVLNIYSHKSRFLQDLGREKLWAWRESAHDMQAIEAKLEKCVCGGTFSFSAKPKCPRCLLELGSPLQILNKKDNNIELWAPNGWQSLYCLIIEKGGIEDPFKT